MNTDESLLKQWKNKNKSLNQVQNTFNIPINVPLPLSHGQEQLWFLQQLYPDNPFYNYSERYLFKGKLNKKYLIAAIEEVFKDHDILRSTYKIVEGKTTQDINELLAVNVEYIDYSNLPIKEFEKTLNSHSLTDATTKFSLLDGPLHKISLLKHSEEEHWLLITLHHIVTDKWSMRVFREQMAHHYRLFCERKQPKSFRQKIQYANYAYHQSKEVIPQEKLEYWTSKLKGVEQVLNLPTDFKRPLQLSYKGELHRRDYSKEFSSSILNLSKNMEITPYVLILSVYYILLYRYTGQKTIAIGSPVANRNDRALEELIGFFNDTLVLKTELMPDMTFKELTMAVRETTLGAFKNKDVPFDVLVKTLKPKRQLNINPFFQVMFIYHNVPDKPFFSKELTIEHRPSEVGVSKFDLTMYVAEEEGVLSSTFEYATDLFHQTTIEKFQNQIETLLKGVLVNQDISISKIPMMITSQDENLDEINKKNSIKSSTEFKNIHQIIHHTAITSPNAIAVTYKDDHLTYKELDEKAGVLAFQLSKMVKGKGENRIIGLCMEKSTDMIVGLLAILKAGCAYLPIDPEYPQERIVFMLDDANVPLILTQESLSETLKTIETDKLYIDFENKLKLENKIHKTVESNDLAYVIYTSGSTGKPKGVPISHGNIVSSTLGRLDFYENNPTAFVLMSSISFDSSKAGIFWTLCTGGNLIITPKRVEQDMDYLLSIFKKEKVSHTLMLPSLYQVFLEYVDKNNVPELNTVIVAGETCPSHISTIHYSILPNVTLYNEYGPTEASVWCIAHKIEQKDAQGIIPIGIPVANAEIYLLNERLEIVPFGAVGEIYIGGPGIAGKYINRADLDTMLYIENPFKKGNLLYKTGDLARYNYLGKLEFYGRSDEQIKIRGFRVELSEIEKTIIQHPNVEEAVVLIKTSVDRSITSPSPKFTDDTSLSDLLLLANNLEKSESEEIIESIENLDDQAAMLLYDKLMDEKH